MPDRYAHCTFCGARFTPGQSWPRRCAACGETSHLNPMPVAALRAARAVETVMAHNEPAVQFNGDFSEPGAEAVPWSDVEAVLAESEMFWLSTVRADGRPHVTPLPAIWLDGALHFCTSGPEQKTKNLEHDPRVALTTGTNRLHAGLDVVVEGTAEPVTERPRLERLAGLWKSKLDWDFGVREGGFTDPQGRLGLVFAVRPAKVLAFGKDPYSQTRYRF